MKTSVEIQIESPHNQEEIPFDYSDILKYYSVEYRNVDYYYQFGTIEQTQGWLLHLSSIISQIPKLLHLIIPELYLYRTPFRIIRDRDAARVLLDGHLGFEKIGKVVTIYPDNDSTALSISKKLITLTKEIRGPLIPTDVHLGSAVYARYGSFNPVIKIDSSGKKVKYIYDGKNKLIRDSYDIPFRLNRGIQWPFTFISKPKDKKKKNLLHHNCKPISVLKNDARGEVLKGLYSEGLFRVRNCLIKQGKSNMISDDAGRDMKDRLKWQLELHNELDRFLPLPKIIDFFEEDSDAYLVMEFINGISLYDLKAAISKNEKGWLGLNNTEKIIILGYIMDILTHIAKLHDLGYIHRDITPVNFLINQEKQMYLIDIELAYSFKDKTPDPPFGFGTPGFMSPEQLSQSTPTVKEDIYGVCATILQLMVGLTPIKFQSEDSVVLSENIYFFIRNREISNMIAAGLSTHPNLRPDISHVKKVVKTFYSELEAGLYENEPILNTKLECNNLKSLIQQALDSIVAPPIVVFDGLWASKSFQDKSIVNEQKEYSIYPGLQNGISGVIFLLSEGKKMGYSIDKCLQAIHNGIEFIEKKYLSAFPNISPGLYGGSSGVGLAIAASLDSRLLTDTSEVRKVLHKCFEIRPTVLNMSEGVAGQGIAIMKCSKYLPSDTVKEILNSSLSIILDSQTRKGHWDIGLNGKSEKTLGLNHGIAGIILFLLEYLSQHHNESVSAAILKALNWLLEQTKGVTNIFIMESENAQDKESLSYDSGAGVIFIFIKAYKVFKDPKYRKAVEDALTLYPDFIINNNLSQTGGLAELGELYLEAYETFKDEKWMERATWLVNVYIHTRIFEHDGCYWAFEENRSPTANFMYGTSGIIHFLLKYSNCQGVGYSFLT